MSVLASTDPVIAAPAVSHRPPLAARLAASAALPVGVYLAVLAVLVLVSWQTFSHTHEVVGNVVAFRGDGVLGGLAHYDGGWYHHISQFGYRYHQPGIQSPVAFFPGYPLAMRYTGSVIGDNALAGILVTVACGMGVAVVFWTWCRDRLTPPAATSALLLLLLYPYGYYLYGVMYAEALFLFATLLAFHLVERDHPVAAGVVGALATFTRPVGIAVVVGLALRTLERRGALTRPGWLGVPTRISLGRVRPRDAGVLLSIGGLAAYAGFLWAEYGDPFLFSEVERYWDQPPGLRTWLKIELLQDLRFHITSPFVWGLLVQGTLALLALATVPFVGRRFGWGYAGYMFVVLAIALVGTKDFQGLGRYVLAAFPVFALAGEHLTERPRSLRYVAIACSGLALVLAAAGFAHGLYLS
ncbi:MAG TPA: hypothetical protein VGO78_02975 [Acidimicrobiales bacterium]|nr:hypothetical protein [Acidimicrobiales bacterium]